MHGVRTSLRTTFQWLLITACAVGAQAQKIRVDYDKQLNFAQFKTYAWAPHGAVAHPMLAANLVGAIEDELKARGMQKVTMDQNPGLIIQVYGSIDQETSYNSTDPLYNGDRRHSSVRPQLFRAA